MTDRTQDAAFDDSPWLAQMEAGFRQKLEEFTPEPLRADDLEEARRQLRLSNAVLNAGAWQSKAARLERELEEARGQVASLRKAKAEVFNLDQARAARAGTEPDSAPFADAASIRIDRDGNGRASVLTLGTQQLFVQRERRGTRIVGLAMKPGAKDLFAKVIRDATGTMIGVEVLG